MKVGHLYSQIISLENLFQAWDEFKKGKSDKRDVQLFEKDMEDNLFSVREQLKNKTYKHSPYMAFNIYDPKFRHIHKATVLDRIVHHAVVSVIGPIFDKSFIFDSYSCRKNKGMHRAVKRLAEFTGKESRNYTSNCYILKLDIKKFFASVDHQILLSILRNKFEDEDLMWLLSNIVNSFYSDIGFGKGIPIGNLTSQIFANIYLNELDKFIKQELKIMYYIRYADDFVIISNDKEYLDGLIIKINRFLGVTLKLTLHENKILIRKLRQGIDFLGYIVLPHYTLPRTKTIKRMFKKLDEKFNSPKRSQSLQSYLGYLSHANAYNLAQQLKNQLWYNLPYALENSAQKK